MNASMDLMPETCREWLGRRLRIRRWTIAYLAAITMFMATHIAVGMGSAGRDAELSRLSSELKQRWMRDEQIQRLLRDIKEVETTVTRYNRLAWPIRVTQAIDAVGNAAPGAVTLTTLYITPREEQPRVPVKKSGTLAEAPAGPRSFMVIEMEGVARGDQDVAQMVAGLEGNRIFSRVSLDYTRAVTVQKTEAREFRLTCEVDLSLRYAVADLPEEN